VFRSLSQIMSLEREVEEGREKERQLERERHDMERQINARSESFFYLRKFDPKGHIQSCIVIRTTCS
jgi:hypothetical protein